MLYNYECTKSCLVKNVPKDIKKNLLIEPHPDGLLIWTVQHGINEDPKLTCPLCNSEARRSWYGIKLQTFVRGNCYLNKDDCRRQMDLRLLEAGQDPYKHMRQPGEVDDLKSKLKKKKTSRR